MNDWLNTVTQKWKFYEKAVMPCPIYCADTVTWQHLFQCQHADSVVLQSSGKFSITKFHNGASFPVTCRHVYPQMLLVIWSQGQTQPKTILGGTTLSKEELLRSGAKCRLNTAGTCQTYLHTTQLHGPPN
eukprot:448989-Ditylum_brightwellii.AAC.1